MIPRPDSMKHVQPRERRIDFMDWQVAYARYAGRIVAAAFAALAFAAIVMAIAR